MRNRQVHGGIRVLLRVEHPDHHIGEADQPVHLTRGVPHHRVMIGQVEQHETGKSRLAAAQRARPRVPVALRHAEPLKQRTRGAVVPDARVRFLGHRAGDADRREVSARQAVEERRLAAAGTSREHYHGVRGRQPHPLAGPSEYVFGLAKQFLAEPVPAAAGGTDLDHPGERHQPGRQAGRLLRRIAAISSREHRSLRFRRHSHSGCPAPVAPASAQRARGNPGRQRA